MDSATNNTVFCSVGDQAHTTTRLNYRYFISNYPGNKDAFAALSMAIELCSREELFDRAQTQIAKDILSKF